ncbi:hypothetical protein CH252_05445, partial [Rhodococcus sp. 06-1477-1B]
MRRTDRTVGGRCAVHCTRAGFAAPGTVHRVAGRDVERSRGGEVARREQVSMRLQKRFLERAGHVVTVVAPRLHRP